MQNNNDHFSNGTGRTARFFTAAIPWAAGLGLFLRIYHYGRNPPMWQDEAATCINILNRSFGGLFGSRLTFSATGPSLLLCLQKALVYVLGDGTYSLRLISVLASCAGLLLMVKLAKALLPAPAAFCATLIAACSDRLLWHASEARHYSSDFLFGVVLLLLFVKTREWPLRRRLVAFAVFCPLAIMLSYPGIFLCTGLMLALLPEVRKVKRASAWVGWVLLGMLVAASFAIFYFFTIKPQRSPEMNAIWAGVFPDLHKPWTLPFWAISSTVGVFDYYVRPFAGGLLLIPSIAGFAIYWKSERNRPLAILIAVPMGCAMLLALGSSYPYAGVRTMVYCMPGITILACAGLAPTVNWLKRRWPGVPGLALAAILFVPIAAELLFSLRGVIKPWNRADTAGASAYILAHRKPDDLVTSNHWEYVYYFRSIGPEFSQQFDDLLYKADGRGTRRVWVVLSEITPQQLDGVVNSIKAAGWQQTELAQFQDATVFLFCRPPQN